MLTLSHLFAHDVIAQQFDEQAIEQAATGRVFAPFANLLLTAYGLELPTETASALKKINVYMAADKAVKLASGPGSKVAAVIVWQALREYGIALLAGMGERSRKKLPADFDIAKLPVWACPVALAQAADKRKAEKAKRDAEKAEQERKNQEAIAVGVAAMKAQEAGTDAVAESGEAIPVSAIEGAPRDLRAEMLAAWNKFAAFIDAGVMTAADRDGFMAQIEVATVCAEPVVDNSKAVKASKAKADKASKANRDKVVTSIKADLVERAKQATTGPVAGQLLLTMSPALAVAKSPEMAVA